jgi:hypothetical protein
VGFFFDLFDEFISITLLKNYQMLQGFRAGGPRLKAESSKEVFSFLPLAYCPFPFYYFLFSSIAFSRSLIASWEVLID